MVSQSAVNFNKELLLAEAGAILGAPIAGLILSHLTTSVNKISSFAVLGAILGSTLFWVLVRIHDKRKNGYSPLKFAEDIAYFTPVAFVISLLTYYPAIFIISKHMLLSNFRPVFSVLCSQMIAFLIFLLAMNIYRYALLKLIGKEL